jgi:pyridoxal phosphate enzyme (YggS family)
MTQLSENLDRLEDAIAAACLKAGRDRNAVELMAVSKTYPASTIAEAAALGLRLFGENRVQEFGAKAPDLETLRQSEGGGGFNPRTDESETAQAKQAAEKLASEGIFGSFVTGHDFSRAASSSESMWALAPEGSSSANPSQMAQIRVHLIGHLQSNKAARAAELFDAVDSVDSIRLAERLNEAAAKLGKRLPILIEVKLSPEETKAGLDPQSAEAAALLEMLPDLQHLETQGLMTIAPWGVAEDLTRACFRSLRIWREKWAAANPRLALDVLSMGMSGDFPLAIEEGATRIRIGTALFGKRQKWTGAE